MKYNNIRELNYSSENYRNITASTVYFDFQSLDTIAGFRYQCEDSTSKQFFNGTEKFELDKKTRTIQINESPTRKSFSSLSILYNSVITLKNVLPLLISDKTIIKAIADTIADNKPCILITVNIGKRRIQNLGEEFDAMKTKYNFIYKIIIEKNSALPVEVLQVNDGNNDFIKTTFTNIATNTNTPAESSWYYSSYTNDYKPAGDKIAEQLLPNGSLAPVWSLKLYNNDKPISLNDLKGKIILLDFWIKNCGPCIASVSHLNELQNKFPNTHFQIISINSYDSKEDVNWFCKKHNAKYSVLLNGKEIAAKYGVSGFPTFFLIGKDGKIIYSNAGYDESIQSQIEEAIKTAQ